MYEVYFRSPLWISWSLSSIYLAVDTGYVLFLFLYTSNYDIYWTLNIWLQVHSEYHMWPITPYSSALYSRFLIGSVFLTFVNKSLNVIHIFFPDTDECESNPCLNYATCMDLINDYNCTCAHGYFGSNCENGMYKQRFHQRSLET